MWSLPWQGAFPGHHTPSLRSGAGQARTADEEARALAALAHAERPEMVQRTLALVLAPEVRPQDAPGLLRDVAERGGPQLDAAWAFLQACAPAEVRPTVRLPGAAARRAGNGRRTGRFCAHTHPQLQPLQARGAFPSQLSILYWFCLSSLR